MVKSIATDSFAASQISDLTPSFQKPTDDEVTNVVKASSPVSDERENTIGKSNLIDVSERQRIEDKNKEAEEAEELENAFEVVSDFMKLYNRNVNFSLDEVSDKTIIKVFDSDSKELIKQFPSEDLLELARKIHGVRQDIDLKSGIFLDEKV